MNVKEILGRTGPTERISLRPRAFAAFVAGFYRQGIAWGMLAYFAIIMVYGGGAAMFWFHSIYLGEAGPAISPVLHWFVDSTAGLFALVPVLFLVLPVATRLAVVAPGVLRPRRFAAVSGGLFAFATAPGPVLHDTFVARGTWLAEQITKWWGDGRPLAPGTEIPPALNMTLQVAFGLPVYIGLMWLGFHTLRALAGARTDWIARPRA